MIESYRCNRCSLVFSNGGLSMQFRPVDGTDVTYFHLCKDCKRLFKGFMEEVRKKENDAVWGVRWAK